MTKLALFLAGIIVVLAPMLAPSLTARTQAAVRVEYLRLTPYGVNVQQAPGRVQHRSGYRACVASTPDWTCREFAPTESSEAALSTALVTLGSEGWDLVNVVQADPDRSYPLGLMYVFKRSAP